MKYDVAVVGAGPAGIFSALTLAENSDLKIAMFDKGPDIDKRVEILERTSQISPVILSGWGGAGAFSDGKLTLSPYVGGWLNEYVGYEKLVQLINKVDEVFLRFGAPRKVYGDDPEAIDRIGSAAQRAGMRLVPEVIRHVGRENAKVILSKMKRHLKRLGVDIFLETPVKHILTRNRRAVGVKVEDGRRFDARYLIVAPGRGGAEWLRGEAERIGLSYEANPVDIGVRVEVPAAIMEHLTSALYEPKLIYTTREFDDIVRTFCVNPHGIVITETLSLIHI